MHSYRGPFVRGDVRPMTDAIWTFPVVILAAIIVAWGAESAQFYVARGVAFAALAWLQTLPEFVIEGTLAWRQDIHLMTANFTGAIRLLVGLGWPLIFTVAATSHFVRTRGHILRQIELEGEQAVEVMALSPPLAYFGFIWFKGSLTVLDALILIGLYGAYIYVLGKVPPRAQEEAGDLPAIPRRIISLSRRKRIAAIVGLFLLGGVGLILVAEPFVESMLALAFAIGVSEFVFIQWVAPFLSEFPEKVSAFYWAKSPGKAPLALLNMMSSNINEWTMLAAVIPIVFSVSRGRIEGVPFDAFQRFEILFTMAQSFLAFLFLLDLRFRLHEAAGLFGLWFIQFLWPSTREEVMVLYAIWIGIELIRLVTGNRRPTAWGTFREVFRRSS